MYLPLDNITLDKIEADFLTEREVSLSVLRLDKIHETISGNKLFKLNYYIESCLNTTHKTLLTFGGAYSNHLAATALLCKLKGIKCIGIVRGNNPKIPSHTLAYCMANNMIVEYVDASIYKNAADINYLKTLAKKYGEFTIVPEGGYGYQGAKGASLIMDLLDLQTPTHVCTCVGTATTLAGLLMNNKTNKKIIAVPVIKNMNDINDRLIDLKIEYDKENLTIMHEYHFGGYAKHTEDLISFMNDFYNNHKIPTDFVYTAKLMYGIFDKIKLGYFPKGSSIVCLHTGGLQGNLSLPPGTLIY